MKQFLKFILGYISLFLLIITLANALDANQLRMYYGFEDSNATANTRINDSKSHFDFTARNLNSSFLPGHVGNAMRWDYVGTDFSNGYVVYNETFYSKYSINVWVKNSGTVNNMQSFWWLTNYTNQAYSRRLSPINSLIVGYTIDSGAAIGSSILNTSFGTGWAMITFVQNGNWSYLYRNGTLITEDYLVVPMNSSVRYSFFYIGNYFTDSMDELSVWNNSLTAADVAILYNNGAGLNYAETVSGSYTNTDYSIMPYSDNYYAHNGSGIINNSNKKYFTNFTVYQQAQDSGLSTASFTYIINSTSDGYAAAYCNYSIISENAYNVNFNNCKNTSDCGFIVVNTEWNTSVKEINYGRALILNDASKTNARYDMPNLYNITSTGWNIKFRYYGGYNSHTTLSIVSPYYDDIANILMQQQGTQLCFYATTSAAAETAPTLLQCVANFNYTSNVPVIIDIFYDTYYDKFYIQTEYNNNIQTSALQNALITNYGMAGIKLTAITQNESTYIDELMVNTWNQDAGLSSITIPSLASCTYSLGSCYNTRIYFSWSPTDSFTYKDFYVCAKSDEDVAAENSLAGQAAWNINSLSVQTKMWIAFGVTIALFLGIFIAILVFQGQGNVAGAIALSIALCSLLFFTVLGFIPIWFLILYIMVAAAIGAILVRSIFTGNNTGG